MSTLNQDPPNSASSLARQIKGFTADLRKSLKERDPWDRDVEFQRKNLRNHYLQLIFLHPSAPQSQNVDSALWLETSHALIKLYRQRIATLDKSISDAPPPPRNKRGGVQGSQQQHGVVEYRKVVQKFRSFLSAEESFYSDLAIRLVRTYGLDEAKPALAALSIQIPSDTASSSAEPSRSALTFSNIPTSPLSTSAREKKLLMVHKALICLGDLARYREQYNEAGGRPKAGKDAHEDGSIRGKGRDGGQQQQPPQAGPRPRNYAKSAEYYLQARLLIPENGNPSNQLAILAMYARDSFGSVLNYYRAICIRLPFPTAKDNLEKTLVKAIDKYKKDGERVESGGGEETKVEVFKEDVVVLHGLWFLKASTSNLPKLAEAVAEKFKKLVSSRSMPSEIVVKVLVMALGALWTTRMWRSSSDNTTKEKDSPEPDKSRLSNAANAEPLILKHILDLIQVLMDIGVEEMKEDVELGVGEGDVYDNLAMKITATFRRTLPALRIASKWIKANLEYVLRSAPSTPGTTSTSTFWSSYASFATTLIQTFPLDGLPSLAAPLEEDIDMKGFAPLKRSMFESGAGAGTGEVHPNEEQLMRIGDLLVDAKFLAQLENAPFYLVNGGFTTSPPVERPPTQFNGHKRVESISPIVSPFSLAATRALAQEEEEGEDDTPDDLLSTTGAAPASSEHDDEVDVSDDNATVSTEDPVQLAMGATLDENDDDSEEMEDERILYPHRMETVNTRTPQTSISPILLAVPNTSTAFPSPLSSAGSSPLRGARPTTTSGTGTTSTTAEDLLLRVLGGGSPTRGSSRVHQLPPPLHSQQQSGFSPGHASIASIWAQPIAQESMGRAPSTPLHRASKSFSSLPPPLMYPSSHSPSTFSHPNHPFNPPLSPSAAVFSPSLQMMNPNQYPHQHPHPNVPAHTATPTTQYPIPFGATGGYAHPSGPWG